MFSTDNYHGRDLSEGLTLDLFTVNLKIFISGGRGYRVNAH